ARAQPLSAEPGSIVARRVAAYLAAVDSPEAAAAFQDRDITPEYRASAPSGAIPGYFSGQKRALGGFELLDLRMVSPRRAEALVRDRVYGARHSLTVDFEDGPQARIVEFDPGPAPLWAPALPRTLNTAQVGETARRQMARGCAAGVFSGAVLVARHDQVLFEQACGEANRRYAVPNTAQTRFNLGSINKMFTAVAILQLVEAGKVSLDDPLSKYADETWLPAEISRNLTVRQLLTHTSGLGSFLGPDWDRASRRLYRELADYKPLVRGERPAFPPGTSWSYSNTGPLLLGVVIEQASGETYFDYVRAHIYRPAGMADSDSWALDDPVPNLAVGYARARDGSWRDNTVQNLFRGGPAGGGYSTVGDLMRFARALQDARLLSKASLDLMWTDHPPHNYGMGFTIETTAAGKAYGHDGIFAGVSTRFHIYPQTGYVVAILGNIDYAAPGLDEALAETFAQSR
ncbi:MAG: serine hydrolase domain-containing protein, partial [Phenylobacterium sp.]